MEYNKAELKALQQTYFIAKAFYETVKGTAEEIERRILSENEFYETKENAEKMQKRGGTGKPERILDPNLTYLFVDDKEQFDRYLTLCYAEYQKAGIADSRGKGYCPDAESRDLLRQAEGALLDYAESIVPSGLIDAETFKQMKAHWKYREQLLNLILRLEV